MRALAHRASARAAHPVLQRTLRYINLAPPQRPCYMYPSPPPPPPPLPLPSAHHCRVLPPPYRDNLFQAFTIQSNALRRSLTFADLLPLAAQLLHALPSHVMQVVKTVGGARGARPWGRAAG